MPNVLTDPSRPNSGNEPERTGGEIVDINTAPAEQLARLPGLDERKVTIICEQRPFTRWDEVRQFEGFGDDTIALLKASGAEIRKL